MAKLEPVRTTNLDGYGNPSLAWSRVTDQLNANALLTHSSIISTVRPDGRPHAIRVGAIWFDGDFYFVSHEESRKGRNLAANPAAVISVGLDGIDVSFEGKATRVTDSALLEKVAAVYRDTYGWPAEVSGDRITAPYNAPSAGPAPWNLYRFVIRTAFGGGTAEPYGATRWDFER
jgi:putative heme iron utilization protein